MPEEKAKEEVKEEFEVLEVDAKGQPVGGKPNGADTAVAGGEATQAGGSGADHIGDEDDEDLDERVALNEEERAARREERKLRNEKRREANRRRELELVDLRRRNEEMERRLAAVEGGQSRINLTVLNERIEIAARQFQEAEQALAGAMANSAKEPGRVVQAMRLRDQARDAHVRLSDLKARYEAGGRGGAGKGAEAGGERTEGRREPTGIDPAVQRRVDAFADKHDWYDLRGGNTDSRIVTAIDQEVAEAGFDPATKEYWDELERRCAKVLPHRFKPANGNGAAAATGGRKAPPMAGGGAPGEGGKSGKTVVKVSPERRKAMEEAGAWDDKVKRDRMLRAYARYDREHANQQ